MLQLFDIGNGPVVAAHCSHSEGSPDNSAEADSPADRSPAEEDSNRPDPGICNHPDRQSCRNNL